MKTFFITGAEGFAGTHLVAHLKSRGHDVVGGVRNRARKLSFEKRFGKGLVCDVSDAISVARAIASVKPQVVVHLAGVAQPAEAAEEPLTAYQSIVTGCANVLDGVRRSVPRAKVILFSACDVYGAAGNNGQPLLEDTPPQPVSTFGSLKATAESIATTFFLNYHLDITIARPFPFIGGNQSERFFFASVARRVAAHNPAGGPLDLALPDLSTQRDLLHVGDVVEAIDALANSGKPNQVYNISSGHAQSVRSVVEMLVQAGGVSVNLSDQQPAEPGTITAMCGNNERLKADTGWQPRRSIEQACKDMITSLRAVRTTTPEAVPAAT